MPEAPVGELIAGRYRVLGLLGEGAMGAVYRAEQLDSEGHPLREVALKTIKPELSRDPKFARRFLLEARIAARIESPHAVTVIDAGQAEDGRLYFSMELVRAPTLKDVLRRDGALPPQRVIDIAAQLAEALAAAHGLREPVVHRDLKPANVFLGEKLGRDWVTVGDFGIAKVLGEEATALTGTGVSLGTPRYMSPEQWRGAAVDGRSDLYSLGVIMHELLTGSTPFGGAVETLMYHHLHQAPPPLPETVPEGLRAIVASLLSKDPEGRPASALALKRSLDSLAGNAETVTAARGEDDVATAVVESGRRRPREHQSENRRTRYLTLGAGALFCAGLVVLWLRHVPFPQPDADETPVRGAPVAGVTPDAAVTRDDRAPTPGQAGDEPDATTHVAPDVEAAPPATDTGTFTEIARPGSGRARGFDLDVDPPGSSVEVAECQSQTFSARSGEPGATHEWSVDGERQSERGARLDFPARDPGRHRVRVVVRRGEQARTHEWTVLVKPEPPSAEEVEGWLASYGRALELKDVSRLRELGEIRTDEEAEQWRRRFSSVRDYEVRLENVEIEGHADEARLTFDRNERWKDPANPAFVLDFASEAKTLVRENCRVIVSR